MKKTLIITIAIIIAAVGFYVLFQKRRPSTTQAPTPAQSQTQISRKQAAIQGFDINDHLDQALKDLDAVDTNK